MPFQSKAQIGFMFAQHPKIAKRWSKEYGTPKNMPMRKQSKKGRKVFITKGKNVKNKKGR